MNLTNIITTYYAYLEMSEKDKKTEYVRLNKLLGRKLGREYFNHMKVGSKPISTDLLCQLSEECVRFQAKRMGYKNIEKFVLAVKGLMPPERK